MPERPSFNSPEEVPLNPLQEKEPKLHISKPVEQAVSRHETQTGERLGRHNPSAKLNVWMKTLEDIHLGKVNPETGDREPREEKIKDRIKAVYHKRYVMKPNEVPESYFELQRRIAREQGHGDVEIPAEVRKEMVATITRDQERSLDAWIDYLSSEDAAYPMWFKYYTFTNIVKLADFDKNTKEFKKRSKSTTAPFPDINREALAYMADSLAKQYNLAPGKTDIDPETKKLLDQDANFAKLYAHAIEKINPASEAELKITEGRWIKYEQGSEGRILAETLQGHGTGWCTAGEGTAQAQLDAGDFYVYYTKNQEGKYRVPRVAIRMQEDRIGEVRGIQADQNLEPALVDIAREKMKDLPGAQEYTKKTADMQMLTGIEKKVGGGVDLTRDELIFLYEINSPIEGFGYERDPRIEKIRMMRFGGHMEHNQPGGWDDSDYRGDVIYNEEKKKEVVERDMAIIFDCEPAQIARNTSEIKSDTKAYVGPIEPGLFTKLPQNIEYVYTKFPEGKVRLETLEIGGQSAKELEDELVKNNINVYSTAKFLMNSKEFVTLQDGRKIELVQMRIGDMGFRDNPTTEQIYARAKELGLELVPAEVGPHYRLKYKDQPLGEYTAIGMKQIAGSDGSPGVFRVEHDGGGLWLNARWASPGYAWLLDNHFVFARGK